MYVKGDYKFCEGYGDTTRNSYAFNKVLGVELPHPHLEKLTADPGVVSSIPARSHTFVEIDHEIISTVVLLPSAESFMKGCCQLQAKLCARLLVNCLFKLAQEKSVVR